MSDQSVMRFFVLCGTVIIGIISLVVIVVATVFPLIKPDVAVPKMLENWGGLIIGFYFGSFVGLVGEWAKRPTATQPVNTSRDST